MKHLTVCVLLCLTAIACGGKGAATPPTAVADLRAGDGATLRASYFAPDTPGPGVLLFHQCNMDRHAWDDLAGDLKAAGFHVLAVDRRGVGDSSGRATQDNSVLTADADVMYKHLLSRPGVDRARVAAGGASCGVGDAINLARHHDEVRTLVLLSGYSDGLQRKFIANTPALAIFGAVSKYDNAKDIEDTVRASSNPRSTVKVYPGSWLGMVVSSVDHGVSMFGHNADLRPAIVSWLQQQMNH